MTERKNINRGFKKLRVWQDSVSLYILACDMFTIFPYGIRKTASQAIDAAHNENLDKLHYKVENGLLSLIKSLQKKHRDGDWLEVFTE